MKRIIVLVAILAVLCLLGVFVAHLPVEAVVFAALVLGSGILSFAVSGSEPFIYTEDQLRRF